jgi:hypothetical protein
MQLIKEQEQKVQVVNIFEILSEIKSLENIQDEKLQEYIEDVIALLGESNEEILEKYYSEELTIERIKTEITSQARAGYIYILCILGLR